MAESGHSETAHPIIGTSALPSTPEETARSQHGRNVSKPDPGAHAMTTWTVASLSGSSVRPHQSRSDKHIIYRGAAFLWLARLPLSPQCLWLSLLQRSSHLPVFVLRERAARLRPYVPLRRRGHRELYNDFLILCFR